MFAFGITKNVCSKGLTKKIRTRFKKVKVTQIIT